MFVPAEWHSQSATLLAWPCEQTDWRPILHAIHNTYAEFIRLITRYQPVILLCYDEATKAHAIDTLSDANVATDKVKTVVCPYNDTWLRDSGPLFSSHNGHFTLHDFIFDGWGEKFAADKDNEINHVMFEQSLFKVDEYERHAFILEGGNLESNGAGLLLFNQRCHQRPNVRPTQTNDLQQVFLNHQILLIDNVVLANDDTDGHIDTLARFAREYTLLFNEANSKHPSYPELLSLKQQLQTLSCEVDTALDLFPLPTPIVKNDDELLAANYANFLLCNDAVIVPVYEVAEDDEALTTLKETFPDRTIEPLLSRTLMQQGGGPHCAAMHIPVPLTLNQE